MRFFEDFFDAVRTRFGDAAADDLIALARMLRNASEHGGKVLIAGNGGSAAIASHAAVDLTKAAGVRATNFNEAALLTCFSNDFGYERWVEKALEFHARPGDAVVLISSSGRSPNILNGAHAARAMGLKLATLSGFDSGNPLRALGQINLWADSRIYNVVETTHYVWLLATSDWIVREKGAAT